MATAKATKASDKAQICRRTVAALQKIYGKSLPRLDLTVVETFLFAICLEDNSWQDALQAQPRLLGAYFDLNEIRVSSVSELEQTLLPLRGADWKGLQIRAILRHVFETTYSFDFEKFRRLTQEGAVKVLRKMPELTPFVRDFVVQHLLDSHVIALDASMLNAARWLGLVPGSLDHSAAAESLKVGVRKSDVNEFCYLLRAVATDVKFRERLAETPERELEMHEAPERLRELQLPPKRRPARRSADQPENEAAPAGAATSAPAAKKEAVAKSEHVAGENGRAGSTGTRKNVTAPEGKASASAAAAQPKKSVARSSPTTAEAPETVRPREKKSGHAAPQPENSAGSHSNKTGSGASAAEKSEKAARRQSEARENDSSRVQASGSVPEKRNSSKSEDRKAPRRK